MNKPNDGLPTELNVGDRYTIACRINDMIELAKELNVGDRYTIACRINDMIELAKELEQLRHTVQGLLANAIESVTVDGLSDCILGGNLHVFDTAFYQDTMQIDKLPEDLNSLLKDWQLKTMKFNKESGEWE